MDQQQNFKNNLILIQKMKGFSLSEYSAELDIPKSTLLSVLEDGSTSLHTAIHISNRMLFFLTFMMFSVLQDTGSLHLTGLLYENWYAGSKARPPKIDSLLLSL